MKKLTTIGIAFVFVFFSFISCGKKPATPEAGSASVDDMLSLVPDDAMGVIFVDFHGALSTEMANKTIKEDKNYQKYQEFMEMTGIDPQKDVYFVTVAVIEGIEKEKAKAAAIINLKYDREKLLNLARQKAAEEDQEILEEDYNGITIYSLTQEKGEPPNFVFLDNSNIIGGDKVGVRSCIDVLQKRKENVFKNKELADLIKNTQKEAMVWGAVLIPAEAMSEAAAQNPMLSNLKAVEATSMSFDYKNKNLIAEIKVMSSDETKNQQIAELLNGVKAMGGMISAKKPEVGELINKIEITSKPDHVKIYASIPEALINRLKEMEKKEEGEL